MSVSQYIAWGSGADAVDSLTYVTDLFPSAVNSHSAPKSRYRPARRVHDARCPRCSWRRDDFATRKAANAAYRQHTGQEHPGKELIPKAEYRIMGHCIRCAGAQYTTRVERPLDPFGPDEPVQRVADGFEGERLPWGKGWLEFEGKLDKPPVCPTHGERLRFIEVVLLRIDGFPAQYMTSALDSLAIDSMARVPESVRE